MKESALDARMKVIQVTPGIDDESSGPSHSVPGLCRGLSAAGCDVCLHCLGSIPERLESASYSIANHDYARGWLKPVGFSPSLLKALRHAAVDADIMQWNGLWMMPDVYPHWATRRTACKLVSAPRGSLAAAALQRAPVKKAVFGALWQWRALRAADMFHATCVKEYEEIRRAGFRQPVAIVPIGLDIPSKHHEVGLVTGRNRKLVFLGRLHSIKGVDRLLMAWQQVHEKLPDWSVEIAGPDCGMLPELRRSVLENKLPRVSFVGELNGEDKYDFLSSADLYALPSETENFGITIAEALACGVPVITTRGTPWRGLEDERCGWWVDNSVEKLVDAVLSAAAMSSFELASMGRRGREWIRREFSWDGIGFKMKLAYEWLINGGERPDWVEG